MPKVANVAEAMQRQAAKKGGPGRTVRLRAIGLGFYGYPLATTIEPGREFNFRVHDLTTFPNGKPRPEYVEDAKHYDGRPVKWIMIDKKKYPLPTWCEDAKQPSSLVEETDEDETFALADATQEM